MAAQRGREATFATATAEAPRRVVAGADRAATAPFVGRDDELTSIVDALVEPPALVLIEGEPGIGKTRLLREALAAASERTTLFAVCPPLPEPFPLGPVVAGLRRLWQHTGTVELSTLGGALRPLFPEWGDQLPAALEPLDDPAETRHRLFRALTELVERLNIEILVIEDTHWADTATLEWLLTVTTATDHTMSVVATYRRTDIPHDSLLLRLTSRLPTGMSHLRVHLEPLDVAQTRQLIGSMFGADDVSEKFATFLHQRADGIPLAIEESVRLLRDRHDIVRHDGQWTRRLLNELDVPPTVRDSVLERVSRLPTQARQVLEAAAVLAEPADETLLTTVAGLATQQGEQGVAAALASGVLRQTSPGWYTFRHILDAQAVGEAIPASQWRRLHHRAADELRTVEPEPVTRLARHYREAGDTEAWCHYTEAAADLALESGDHFTAAALLDRVFTVLEHPTDRRARLVRKLGEAGVQGLVALGDLGDRIVAALREVLAADDLPAGAGGELRLLLGRLHMQLGEFDEGYAEIEASLPDLENQPALAARAMLFLAIPVSPTRHATEHVKWLERATRLVQRIESAAERMSCVADRAMILLMLGEEAGWQAVAEMPTSAPTREEQQDIARGLLNVGQSAITWGRFAEARRYLEQAADMAQAIGYLRVMPTVRVAMALLDWYTGNWAALDNWVDEIAQAEDAKAMTRMEARLIQGLLAAGQGTRGSAQQQLRSVMQDAARRGHAEPATLLAPAALARLHLADDAIAEALELTEPTVAMITTKGVWIWGADIVPTHVHALVAAGKLDHAEDLVGRFTEGIEGRDAPAPAAALVLCRAILAVAQGDHDTAADLFAEAAAAWAALPRPYDELLALERQGLSLMSASERDHGLGVLTDAEQRLRQLGAKWDADRVAHLLRQHGVEVSRAWKRGPRGYGEQLSPRELEVLALVAQGMSNRDVGQVLFLSPRTVGVHMGAVMRKLGVSSRTAAAMAAAESGLIAGDDEFAVGDSAAT